jgi:colanic acid biosynthesis protein WcaH
MLSNRDFRRVVENTNLFAFDLIIKNFKEQVLIAKRNNAPAKDYWFVPGGRVYKNENLNDAFDRILKEETGLVRGDLIDINEKGLYNHIYEDSFFKSNDINTHYIVYSIECALCKGVDIVLDRQHSQYKFIEVNDLILSNDVHVYTKNYFIDKVDNTLSL